MVGVAGAAAATSLVASFDFFFDFFFFFDGSGGISSSFSTAPFPPASAPAPFSSSKPGRDRVGIIGASSLASLNLFFDFFFFFDGSVGIASPLWTAPFLSVPASAFFSPFRLAGAPSTADSLAACPPSSLFLFFLRFCFLAEGVPTPSAAGTASVLGARASEASPAGDRAEPSLAARAGIGLSSKGSNLGRFVGTAASRPSLVACFFLSFSLPGSVPLPAGIFLAEPSSKTELFSESPSFDSVEVAASSTLAGPSPSPEPIAERSDLDDDFRFFFLFFFFDLELSSLSWFVPVFVSSRSLFDGSLSAVSAPSFLTWPSVSPPLSPTPDGSSLVLSSDRRERFDRFFLFRMYLLYSADQVVESLGSIDGSMSGLVLDGGDGSAPCARGAGVLGDAAAGDGLASSADCGRARRFLLFFDPPPDPMIEDSRLRDQRSGEVSESRVSFAIYLAIFTLSKQAS